MEQLGFRIEDSSVPIVCGCIPTLPWKVGGASLLPVPALEFGECQDEPFEWKWFDQGIAMLDSFCLEEAFSRDGKQRFEIPCRRVQALELP